MPLGAARIALLAKTQVTAVAEVIRKQVGVSAINNAQIDTADYKFGGASLLMDGTDDYLQIKNDDKFDLTQSTWTIEAWINTDTVTGNLRFIAGKRTGTTGWAFYINNADIVFNALGRGIATGSSAISINTWHHVAATRDGNDIEVFCDGVSVGTATLSGEISTNAADMYIGLDSTNGTRDWDGHVDEFRISDTVRYTTTFTPSTTPFVNDDNTLLLLHMDGTDGSTYFPDDNGVRDKIGIRALGDAQVDTGQSYFGGSSLIVDGSDELRASSPNFSFGSSDDFTIEGWVRITTSGNRGMFHLDADSDYYPASETGLAIAVRPHVPDYVYYAGAKYTVSSPTTTPATGTWYHVALSRSSGTIRFFVNGIEEDSHSDTNTYSGEYLLLGGYYGSGFRMIGHIDEFRISDTARYTTGFTPSTEPFVNDENTLFLMHCDGTDGSTDFEDDNGKGRSRVGVTAVANAQVDTAQSQFGGSSAYFDGAGDYLDTGVAYSWGSSQDFTWECWFRQDTNTQSFPILFCNYEAFGANDWGVFVDRSNDNKVSVWVRNINSGAAILESTTTIADDTWYHLAVTRSGSSWNLWIDGTSEDSTTSSTSIDTADRPLYIGMAPSTSTTAYHGWIDEFRMSTTARYSTTFTPSTTPFQNDADTFILLHMDGTDGSTVFRDDNGTY